MWWAIIAVAVAWVVLWAMFTFAVQRDLSSLARIRCPSCGTAFGMTTAKNAKRQYSEQCEAERKRLTAVHGRFLRIHFDDKWPVKCEHCGFSIEYTMLSEDQKRAALKVPRVPLRFLVSPEPSVKKLNGMEAFSDSAYFHRMHDLLWTLRNAEVVALLSDEEREYLAEFNRQFDALPWRVIADHPHISELPDDDLSPLVPSGEKLLRMLETRAGKLN